MKHFFGTMHEDIWKQLFKAQKEWPEETEDKGFDSVTLALEVSTILSNTYLVHISIMTGIRTLMFHSGLDEESGADQLSDSVARKPSHAPTNGDAGSGAVQGAGEEGQEEG